MLSGIGAQIAYAFSFAALLAFVHGLADAVRIAQDLRTRLMGLTHGNTDYAASEAYLVDLAGRHHKNVSMLTESYAAFLALEQSGIITRQQSTQLLEGFSNAGSKVGASQAQIAQSVYGLAQALGTGIVAMEEFKQITEPMPGLANEIAKAFGMSVGALRKLIGTGTVTSEEFGNKFVTALKSYEGAAAATAGNISASYADLANEYVKMAKKLEKPIASGLLGLVDSGKSAYGWIKDNGDGIVATLSLIAATLTGKVLSSFVAYIAMKGDAIAVERAHIAALIEYAQRNLNVISTNLALNESNLALVQADIAAEAAKLALTNTTIAQTRAEIAALQATVQTTSVTYLLRRATAALSAEEIKRSQILANMAVLGRQQAAISQQVTQATGAQTVATAALTEATNMSGVAMTRFAAAGKAAFAFIGGWVGVAVIALYGLYSILEKITGSERKAEIRAKALTDALALSAVEVKKLSALEVDIDFTKTSASIDALKAKIKELETFSFGKLLNVGGVATQRDNLLQALDVLEQRMKQLEAQKIDKITNFDASALSSDELNAALNDTQATIKAIGDKIAPLQKQVQEGLIGSEAINADLLRLNAYQAKLSAIQAAIKEKEAAGSGKTNAKMEEAQAKADQEIVESSFKLREQLAKNAYESALAMAGNNAAKKLAIDKAYNEQALKLTLERLDAEAAALTKTSAASSKATKGPELTAKLAIIDNQKAQALSDAEAARVKFRADEQKQAADDTKAAIRADLDINLNAAKNLQDALQNTHDGQLKDLENTYKDKELALKRSLNADEIDEIEYQQKSLELTKIKETKKQEIERAFILESDTLQKASLDEQLKVAKAEMAALSKSTATSSSLAGLVAGGESGGDYNVYNRGTIKNTTLPSEKPLDLESMTIAEIQARQALSIANKDRIGAAGKYQVIADTLKSAVAELKLSADTKFDAATQEKIFTEYLVAAKRPALQNFITGKSTDINAAQLDLAKEQAVVPNPNTGESYHKGKGGNAATMTTPQIQAALNAARDQYQQNINTGMGHQAAYTSALSASPTGMAATVSGANSSVEERQAANAKIAQLESQQVAQEADTQAKLKSLGLDAQAAQLEQSAVAIDIKKKEDTDKKALASEQLNADRAAALDELALRESAAQQELDLGNITEGEHLEQLRGFADERLAIEQKLLDEKRKLLDSDKLAVAQNLNERAAAERTAMAERLQIAQTEEKNRKAMFEGMVTPLKNAMSQMTNGVLTGQQTIGNAVRNMANSILVSYASTFMQERAMDAAQWAWKLTKLKANSAQEKALKNGDVIWAGLLWAKEKAMLAGQWAWETLGFAAKENKKKSISWASKAWDGMLWAAKQAEMAGQWLWEAMGFSGKEATKVGVKVVGEQLQTVATTEGNVERAAIEKTANAESALGSAWKAAKGAFASVMEMVPFPFNVVLAPIAGMAAFAGTLALGSAKGGEWQVREDGSPYILHEKESVLPAGVADNFRKVVSFVQERGLPDKSSQLSSVVSGLVDSGQLHGNWALPASVTGIAHQAAESAGQIVKNGQSAGQKATNLTATQAAPEPSSVTHNHEGDIHLYIDAVDDASVAKLLHRNSDTIAKVVREKVKGAKVPRTAK
nr:tape measure protein [Methylovulum psychrotolerans]